MNCGSSRLSISAVLISSLLFFSRSILSSMAEATTKPDEATVQIVYVEKPEAEEPEAFHIRTLAAVLGSEEAATDAVIYHYKHATSGFSAKLTQSQVEQLSRQPGVLQVVPSRTYNLHGSRGGTSGVMGL
ncbi:unnamed protein product [Musa acuminata subsp. malaccensis]|uniref:(wild Malaysian banana) hypothetical protein n=1 Tax=Musa acuminata subsp. malaccensis TaxID=214687 RepID=A0A804IZJ2_MUSAM|nr:PREDICTED: subtilisin-like protease SBT3.9 [Musa acuminata subsp. malaccensis]CAG1837158.1 unnamed protein product [Musa acuminata subsp. malaccensis]